jgi:hypothetical protein
LDQAVCIPRRYVVYVNHFTNLLSTVVGRFISVLLCSACLDKIVSYLVKDSCIILISVCLLCYLMWLLAFRYYFWLLGRMSISVGLQFSVVLQGFYSRVSVYL